MKIRLILVFALIPAISFAQRDAVPYQVIQTKTDLLAKEKTGDTEVLFPGNWLNIDSATIHPVINNGGYVAGTNVYGDLAKAQRFSVDKPGHIIGARYWFGVRDGEGGSLAFNIWSFNDNPGTVLASRVVPANQVGASHLYSQAFYVEFHEPVPVDGDFVVGFDMSGIGQTQIALVSTYDGQAGGRGLSWEKWSDGKWYTFLDPDGWDMDIDLAIFPIIRWDSDDPQIPELQVTAVVNRHVSCFGGNDGQATATATGGVEPYTWLWSDGQQTDVVYNLVAGTHQVTLTDDLGNTAQAEVTITEPSPLEVVLTTTNPTTYDGSNGMAVASVSGGTSPYTYLWTDPGEQQTQTITGLAAGTYMLAVTDSNGCTAIAMATLTSPDPYPNITYDALAIRFTSGAVEIIPMDEIRIMQFDFATPVDATSVPVSTMMTLSNYPNPFSGTTTIEFELARPGHVDIMIYDVTGRSMRRLMCPDCAAGSNRLEWDGRDDGGGLLHSGVYMVRLIANDQVSNHRMLLVR